MLLRFWSRLTPGNALRRLEQSGQRVEDAAHHLVHSYTREKGRPWSTRRTRRCFHDGALASAVGCAERRAAPRTFRYWPLRPRPRALALRTVRPSGGSLRLWTDCKLGCVNGLSELSGFKSSYSGSTESCGVGVGASGLSLSLIAALTDRTVAALTNLFELRCRERRRIRWRLLLHRRMLRSRFVLRRWNAPLQMAIPSPQSLLLALAPKTGSLLHAARFSVLQSPDSRRCSGWGLAVPPATYRSSVALAPAIATRTIPTHTSLYPRPSQVALSEFRWRSRSKAIA